MEDYEQVCPTCGRIVDKHNPSILAHGNWNEETKQYECYDLDGNVIPFSSSMKKGDITQWTSDHKRIDSTNFRIFKFLSTGLILTRMGRESRSPYS